MINENGSTTIKSAKLNLNKEVVLSYAGRYVIKSIDLKKYMGVLYYNVISAEILIKLRIIVRIPSVLKHVTEVLHVIRLNTVIKVYLN